MGVAFSPIALNTCEIHINSMQLASEQSIRLVSRSLKPQDTREVHTPQRDTRNGERHIVTVLWSATRHKHVTRHASLMMQSLPRRRRRQRREKGL